MLANPQAHTSPSHPLTPGQRATGDRLLLLLVAGAAETVQYSAKTQEVRLTPCASIFLLLPPLTHSPPSCYTLSPPSSHTVPCMQVLNVAGAGPGTVVGEGAALHNLVYEASLNASTDCKVFSVRGGRGECERREERVCERRERRV